MFKFMGGEVVLIKSTFTHYISGNNREAEWVGN